MSKDGNPDISEFDPLANKPVTQEEQKAEQELFSQTTPIEQQEAGDGFIVTPASSAQSTPSISSLSGSISPDGQTVDPITEAIRKEILEKQRNILREYFAGIEPKPELVEPSLKVEEGKQLTPEELAAEEEKDKKFRTFLSNPDNRGLIDKAFEDSETKKKLEAAEIAGYRNVLSTYSAANGYQGGFKPVQWENQINASDLRATVVKNDVGDELCTLNETTHKTKPFTVTKQNGEKVEVSSYREIDFLIKLDKADGSMHLSMIALKADGTKPSKDKAVYFTAHYEEGPNGKPQLKEISSPKPLKFAGDGPDAVAYIEHGGEIYTLAVTRGKYQEMMREVAINKGQNVDLSQAEDLIKGQGQSKTQETQEPAITPQQTASSTITPPSTAQSTNIPEVTSKQVPSIPANPHKQHEIPPMPQPGQAESSGMPNPMLNAATALSGSMQDLLNYVNAGLTKETDGNKQIDLIKEAATAILNNEKSDVAEKQDNINALTENIVNSENLAPEAKVAGVSAVLETIKNDQNTPDLEKSKMLEGTVAIALNSKNLEPTYKQQIVEKAVDSGLVLNDVNGRANAIEGITDAVIKSNLSTEDKGTMLIAVGDKVNTSAISNAEKQKLLGSVLKKGVEAVVLSEEQQQLMQQNLDKITAEQAKEETIAAVQGILVDPIANKSAAIQDVTTKVLDSPVKAEIKGKIIEGVTKTVAESSLDAKDKADIVKGVGTAIANNDTISPAEKVTIIESAEKGVAESKTDLPVRELMTKGLVDGVYEGKASPEITFELTKAVSSGIDNSNINDSEKEVLKKAKEAAIEAVLDRETQNLNKDLQEQNLNKEQTNQDLHGAAKGVMDALKDVVDPAKEALEKPKEQIVQETSSILNDISKLAVEKVNNFRKLLDEHGNLKTIEEKRVESEQQINKLVDSYKAIDKQYEPEYKNQEAQGIYNSEQEYKAKKEFIEQSGLGDNEKIKLLSAVIQYERDNNANKPGVNNNVKELTENRTKIEEKVATQDKSKVGYDTQLKPRNDTGRVP